MNITMKKEEQKKLKRKFIEPNTNATHAHSALSAIYKDEQGGNIDMTKFDRKEKYRIAKIASIIILVLAVIGAAIFGFMVFRGKSWGTKKTTVRLDVEGPENVASGETLSFDVIIENDDAAGLKPGMLTISYPDGFRFQKAVPAATNPEGTRWVVPEIKGGGVFKMTVTGQLLGEIQSTQEFSGNYTYQPENFSSNFEIKKTWSISIESSILNFEIDAPQRSLPEQDLDVTLSYENTSEIDIEEIKIQVAYPEEFTFVSADPKPNEKDSVWYIKDVKSKAKGKILLHGTVDAEAGKEVEFKGVLSLKEAGGLYTEQIQKNKLVLIVNPEFNLSLKINESSEDATFSLEDTFHYKVEYKNNSDLAFVDASLILEFDGDTNVLDFNGLEYSGDHKPVVADGKVTWDGTLVNDFVLIPPNESGVIEWSIPVKKNIDDFIEPPKNLQLKHSVHFDFTPQDKELQSDIINKPQTSITTKLKTESDVHAEARYYSNDRKKVGSGPLPPEVDRPTTYRVYWTLVNTHNDIKDVRVTTKLPDNVLWSDEFSSGTGNLSYNFKTREVAWDLPLVPAYTSPETKLVSSYFDVTINPTQEDLGKVMIITNETNLNAHDTFTGADIIEQKPVLNSDIPTDPIGKGQGTVVKTTVDEPTNGNGNSNSNGSANVNTNTNANKNTNNK